MKCIILGTAQIHQSVRRMAENMRRAREAARVAWRLSPADPAYKLASRELREAKALLVGAQRAEFNDFLRRLEAAAQRMDSKRAAARRAERALARGQKEGHL